MDEPLGDLERKTATGIGWTVLSQAGAHGVYLVLTVILARLLSPAAFGLNAMLNVLTGFAELFEDLGFGSALVQRREIRPAHFDSVFWLASGTGALLMALFLACAPWVARFYGQPALAPLTRFVSVAFLLRTLGIVQSFSLRRQLAFRRLTWINLAALFISGLVAIIMAVFGMGVWSLAWQFVILAGVTTVLLWLSSDWRPALRFEWLAIKELLGFSANFTGFLVVSYWVRNGDNVLVGKYLGSMALGIYSKAYRLLLTPLTLISAAVGQVMFPALSTIQHDKERVGQAFLRAAQAVALLTFPMMLGLFLLADHFVLAVFGPPWAAMVPLARIYALVAIVQSVTVLDSILYLSQGETSLRLRVGVLTGIVQLAAIGLGLRWGVVGVATLYGLATAVLTYPTLFIVLRLVELKVLDLLAALRGVILCTLAMGLAVWLAGLVLPHDWTDWAHLAVRVPLGVLVYALSVHCAGLEVYLQARRLLLEPALRKLAARLHPARP